MIALCAEHHAKTDAGAFTNDQLRQMKSADLDRRGTVSGRFEWMRNKLLAVVGGSFYYETPIILKVKGQPAIWLNRDQSGSLLLNIRMLTTSREPRLHLEDNDWIALGNLKDFECPPHGRLIHALYPKGDELRIEYVELSSLEVAQARYLHARTGHWDVEFPITAVEVQFKVGGTEIDFGLTHAVLPGRNIVQIGFAKNCGCGIALD